MIIMMIMTTTMYEYILLLSIMLLIIKVVIFITRTGGLHVGREVRCVHRRQRVLRHEPELPGEVQRLGELQHRGERLTILYYTISYCTILYTIYYILYTIYYILYYTILYYTILYYILCIEVNAARALPVSALAFATEAGYDMLTVNGVVYHGSAGPEALTVSM